MHHGHHLPLEGMHDEMKRRFLLTQLILGLPDLSPSDLRVLTYRYGLVDGVRHPLEWISRRLDRPVEELQRLEDRVEGQLEPTPVVDEAPARGEGRLPS